MADSNFRENYKVDTNQVETVENKCKKMLEKLEKDSKTYYPNNEKADNRTQVLRSSENILVDLMLHAHMLHTINHKSKGIVDSYIVMRSKSEDSYTKKTTQREDRQPMQPLHDIQAATWITDRIHNSPSFNLVFSNSIILQGLYSERNNTLQLMKDVISFILDRIENRELYKNPTPLSGGSQEEKNNVKQIEESIRIMKHDCENILNNINTYYTESGTEVMMQDEFPVEQYIGEMCTDLLKDKINEKKEELDKIITKQEAKRKSESDSKKRRTIKGYIDYCYQVKEDIKNYEEKNQTASVVESLKNIFKDEEFDVYTKIIDYINSDDESEKARSEKRASEFLMVMLYKLLQLEFKKYEKSQYTGKEHFTTWSQLHEQLVIYEHKNCEIEGKKKKEQQYDHADFKLINELYSNLKELNSRLSDKLQFEMIEYQMKYFNLNSLIQKYLGVDECDIEFKNKDNGYVAKHCDYPNYEIKAVSHHSNGVMTEGTASYVSGRNENVKEKKKDIRDVDYEKYILTPTEGRPPIITNAMIRGKVQDKLENEEISNIVNQLIEDRNNPIINEKIQKWRENVFQLIPKYYTVKFDKKEQVAQIYICSEAQNINTLYTQTSVIPDKKKAEQKVKQLINLGLISTQSLEMKINYEDCRRFANDILPDLRQKLDEKGCVCENNNEKTPKLLGL